jgi:methionyl-tRNA synthetase
MEWRCPTCRAPYKGGNQCYRCQTDLSRLLAIQKQADELKSRAMYFFREGRPEDARRAIQKSLFLRHDSESERIEILILASAGDFSRVLPLLK